MEEQWCPRREWGRGEERIWGIQQNFSSRHSSYIVVCARVGVETPLSLFVVVILAPRLASLSIEVCIPPEEEAIASKACGINVSCNLGCLDVQSTRKRF